jgi:3-phosphoshikimate 1-carboxyvinyltransferase
MIRLTPGLVPENVVLALPGSKSISNRLLVIAHFLGQDAPRLLHLSEADDTRFMVEVLGCKDGGTAHCGDAGTVLRFALACFSVQPGVRVLTGSDRLCKRPLAPLVEALRSMGVHIEYLGEEGFAPVRVTGAELHGEGVVLPATISSQFVSALCLIAPHLPKPVTTLDLQGPPVSRPYIDMTLNLIRSFGIRASWNHNMVEIFPSPYQWEGPATRVVEPDWSSASYWVLAVALGGPAEVLLPGLSLESLQGDKQLSYYAVFLGVHLAQQEKGVVVRRLGKALNELVLDLRDEPDLAPALAVAMAAKGIRGRLNGLSTLNQKESRRLEVLERELCRCFGSVLRSGPDWLEFAGGGTWQLDGPLHPEGDHRMAMAFAMLAYLGRSITLEQPEAVNKSYPTFWQHLGASGIRLEQQ